MASQILSQTRFDKPDTGWTWPGAWNSGTDVSVTPGSQESFLVNGPGVHTRNGDTIELHFKVLTSRRGVLHFGFAGGMEHAMVALDFKRGKAALATSDWSRVQPEAKCDLHLKKLDVHVLKLEKREGGGNLVKLADVRVYLDGEEILSAKNVNVLPEIGVRITTEQAHIHLKKFVHRGAAPKVPSSIHVGAWQMLNRPSVEDNLASLTKGIHAAAERGVQLLVTPETSITGLFPTRRVTHDSKAIAQADTRLRKILKGVRNAPYLVAGLPAWWTVNGDRRARRYNTSRVYTPDGDTLATCAKIHSCEIEFDHGRRLHEFDVLGVPVSLHICHDTRYPDVWTLPIMFGARLILHPSNDEKVRGGVDGFEAVAGRSTRTSDAFYVHADGNGGSYIAGPQKYNNVLAVSAECRRDAASFPSVGPAQECLLDAIIRLDDAFGYWPVRTFRASEAAAEAYLRLYETHGGQRSPANGR